MFSVSDNISCLSSGIIRDFLYYNALMRISVSIGIMAHNEEHNIGLLLDGLSAQKLKNVSVKEIIVISSGSTDETNAIVQDCCVKNPKLKLIVEPKRSGKSHAVNIFLKKAACDVVVLLNADLNLTKNVLEKLVSPLTQKTIGMTGCHPVPVNDASMFMGFAGHLLWDLHHQISLREPKMGEMIAFKKIFKKIPELSAVDEANIEPLIRGQGYKAVYVPDAVVHNKSPETIREFVARRRHIYAGHLATRYEYSYEVSTLSNIKMLVLVLKNIQFSTAYLFWTPCVIMLELYSRFLGYLDYVFKLKNHTVWERTPSTKKLR